MHSTVHCTSDANGCGLIDAIHPIRRRFSFRENRPVQSSADLRDSLLSNYVGTTCSASAGGADISRSSEGNRLRGPETVDYLVATPFCRYFEICRFQAVSSFKPPVFCLQSDSWRFSALSG